MKKLQTGARAVAAVAVSAILVLASPLSASAMPTFSVDYTSATPTSAASVTFTFAGPDFDSWYIESLDFAYLLDSGTLPTSTSSVLNFECRSGEWVVQLGGSEFIATGVHVTLVDWMGGNEQHIVTFDPTLCPVPAPPAPPAPAPAPQLAETGASVNGLAVAAGAALALAGVGTLVAMRRRARA